MSKTAVSIREKKTIFRDPYVDWRVYLEDSENKTHVPVFVSQSLSVLNKYFGRSIFFNSGEVPKEIKTADDQKNKLNILIEPHDILPYPENGEVKKIDELIFSGYVYLKIEDYAEIIKGTPNVSGVNLQGLIGTIEDVALPVSIDERPDVKSPRVNASSDLQRQTMVGIIDDGIAFLNNRFRDGFGNSTIQSIWLQSLEEPNTGSGSVSHVRLGKILTQENINELFKKASDKGELSVYQGLNLTIGTANSHNSTEHSFSHGTAILDIAAGYEPGGDAPDGGIIAVQLPPTTLQDTSGTQLDSYLLMGINWMLKQAQQADRNIIINVSLGISAGVKSGNRFTEDRIRKMVKIFNDTNNPLSARVVFAFGNSYRDHLVARLKIQHQNESTQIASKETIEWVVQPDNTAASFLQVHLNKPVSATLENLELQLTSPKSDKFSIVLSKDHYLDHMISDKNGNNKIIARTYRDDVEGLERLIIAVAPTTNLFEPKETSIPGTWKIEFTPKDTTELLDIIVQVQRGDRATGFAQGGRQSYLEHRNSGVFKDPETSNYEMPVSSGNGITRLGTNNALLSRPNGNICVVGSAMPAPETGDENAFKPTLDTAAAADWSRGINMQGGKNSFSPCFSTVAEDGSHSPGVIASGTFSGSTVTISGTSVAAALYVRSLWTADANKKLHAPQSNNRLGGGVVEVKGGARIRHPELA